MYNIFILNFIFKCNFKCNYQSILSWMSNLARVLVTCIRHPDVHNFTYNCIFVRLLYIFVYIKLNK